MALRTPHLRKTRRLVVKVGSAVLAGETGLDLTVMEQLADSIATLWLQGIQVLLVSSGAVAAGRRRLSLSAAQVAGLKNKQAAAAVGQSTLMGNYEEAFHRHGFQVAQVLLTHDDLSHRGRYLNIRNTLYTLLEWRVVPIINENDTVSVEELRFGDNDTLAALVATLIEADALVCLTDVQGLFTADPATTPSARLILTVPGVDKSTEEMAGFSGSSLGTGGMRSKIKAAGLVSRKGGWAFIGPGRSPGVLEELFQGKRVGTFFLPEKASLSSRKQWIASVLRPKGRFILDQGACRALTGKGKSLLASGILAVQGTFEVGDAVRLVDESESEIGVGLVNYDSGAVAKIRGRHSGEILSLLGYMDSDEVIHRDNLVVTVTHNKTDEPSGR